MCGRDLHPDIPSDETAGGRGKKRRIPGPGGVFYRILRMCRPCGANSRASSLVLEGNVSKNVWRDGFQLGRLLTPVDRGSALISWSGSMFEYLMPSLVMRAPAESLVGQTNRLVVRRQITYGAELGVPWGVSESAYN